MSLFERARWSPRIATPRLLPAAGRPDVRLDGAPPWMLQASARATRLPIAALEVGETSDTLLVTAELVADEGTGPVGRVDFAPAAGPVLLAVHAGDGRTIRSVRFSVQPKATGAISCRPRLRFHRFASAEDFAMAAAAFSVRRGPPAGWQIRGHQGLGRPAGRRRWAWGDAGAASRVLSHATELAGVLAAAAPPPAGAQPWFSFVVPTHDTPPHFLDDLLLSFKAQRPGTAELVLSDDGSTASATRRWLDRLGGDPAVVVVRAPVRRGIAAASRAGIAAASGAFVGFLDHDDALTPFTTDVLAAALKEKPGTEILYTDEVVTNSRLRPTGLFLKPAFDPVLLSGCNYINHLTLVRRGLLSPGEGPVDGFEGSQDYEMLLRLTQRLGEESVTHCPFPAYRWRRHRASFSTQSSEAAIAAARRALQAHSPIRGVDICAGPAADPALHRVRPAVPSPRSPLVSVILPFRDRPDLLSRVLAGLSDRTSHQNLEIVLVDNGSRLPETAEWVARCRVGRQNTRAVRVEEPFNFSRLVNAGAAQASGDLLLLLNNDVEMLAPDWLDEMIECFAFDRVGIVGPRLLYPNGRIQHAGVIVGLGGLAGHWHVGSKASVGGPMNRLKLRQTVGAVTGACMLVSRRCWEATGPLDEERFAIAYNDVDFCLRAAENGFRTVWTPNATLVHHESLSRGSDETRDNADRFAREKAALRSRHGTEHLVDRAYNPWWGRGRAIPVPSLPTVLPAAR